jgi:hypothetical protein
MKSESDVVADFNATFVCFLIVLPLASASMLISGTFHNYLMLHLPSFSSVNMTPKSLRAWLETEDSQTTSIPFLVLHLYIGHPSRSSHPS